MLERDYQNQLINRLKLMFPGCMVLKNDSGYIQGIPDLLILFEDKWAAVEVKVSQHTENQPNQEYYVCEMNDMSFAAFVYPENEEEVLNALQQTLRPSRSTRIS